MEAIRVSHFALYYGQLCGTGCVHAIPCRGHQRNESAPSEYGCALQRHDHQSVSKYPEKCHFCAELEYVQ